MSEQEDYTIQDFGGDEVFIWDNIVKEPIILTTRAKAERIVIILNEDESAPE